MADMVLLQGAISGLKAAADIAIGLNRLNTMTEVNAKAIELQQIILNVQSAALNAQSEQAAMVEEIRQLKEEIARVKAWEESKQRYRLVSPYGGFFTYALKTEGNPSEPAHWICAKCYEDGMKSILHVEKEDIGRKYFQACPRCKTRIQTGHSGVSPAYV